MELKMEVLESEKLQIERDIQLLNSNKESLIKSPVDTEVYKQKIISDIMRYAIFIVQFWIIYVVDKMLSKLWWTKVKNIKY